MNDWMMIWWIAVASISTGALVGTWICLSIYLSRIADALEEQNKGLDNRLTHELKR